MSPGLWLAGTLGRQRRDGVVIRWVNDPHHLATVPSGVRWDTIAMPHSTGARVLEELLHAPQPEEIGPVLADTRTGRSYWLIPLGSFPTCRAMPPEVELLLPGQSLQVPDPDPDPDAPAAEEDAPQPVTWEHWPTTNGTLTPPGRLAALLTGLRRTRPPSRCPAGTIRRPGTCPRRHLHARTRPPRRRTNGG